MTDLTLALCVDIHDRPLYTTYSGRGMTPTFESLTLSIFELGPRLIHLQRLNLDRVAHVGIFFPSYELGEEDISAPTFPNLRELTVTAFHPQAFDAISGSHPSTDSQELLSSIPAGLRSHMPLLEKLVVRVYGKDYRGEARWRRSRQPAGQEHDGIQIWANLSPRHDESMPWKLSERVSLDPWELRVMSSRMPAAAFMTWKDVVQQWWGRSLTTYWTWTFGFTIREGMQVPDSWVEWKEEADKESDNEAARHATAEDDVDAEAGLG